MRPVDFSCLSRSTLREEHHSDEEVAVEEAAGEAAAAVVAVDPQLLLITKVREATRYLLDRSR